MSPQDFIDKWGPGSGPQPMPGPAYALNEEQGAQSHFLDLCELLGVPKPGSEAGYRFEEKSALVGGRTGYADVFKSGVFAWENKAPGKNLDAALKQLLGYSLALQNPPILVVCDRLQIRIHTQFTGHPSERYEVLLAELAQPPKLALLRRIWLDPESFRPKKTSRDITEAAARSFAAMADGLRQRGQHPDQVAHFLTQCLFCFFAEDVGLLPGRMFEALVNNRRLSSDKLTQGLHNLFSAMQSGGLFGSDDIPWFNGGLFRAIAVPPLTIMEMTELRNAAALNWSAIDVSIFGTLFERGLDPAKRSQLGAHYTDPATIGRIIEPVLVRPLLRQWEQTAQEMQGLLAKSTKKNDARYRAARSAFIGWLDTLKDFRVLDPACGSGNFLFLGLKALKDIELQSHLAAQDMGLDREADLVTGPHNLLGIEINEYAAELARVTVWIGELQWRLTHGYEFKTNPVLEPLEHIECRDALLAWLPLPLRGEGRGEGSSAADTGAAALRAGQPPGAQRPADFLISRPAATPPTAPPLGAPTTKESGVGSEFRTAALPETQNAQRNSALTPVSAAAGEKHPVEAAWPWASVVIGNPPFLGGSKKRRELGDEYFAALDSVFAGRVPGGADLVCYWFDKARQALANNGLGAAGLVATQSIRSGSNRSVLQAICAKARIFDAWSDEPWVNDGAAVRVSLVSFGWGECCFLNGDKVEQITAELGSSKASDMTLTKPLLHNAEASFEGTKKYGKFDIAGQLAREWLQLPNPHGKSNADVLKPWRNGRDLAGRQSGAWIIDFGTSMDQAHASLYEHPFMHVSRLVKPLRGKIPSAAAHQTWWLHERPRVALRQALSGLPRFIATPRVAKHRFFVFLHASVLPDSRLNAITRADDATFGILSSRIHEVWSLAQASMHGVGNDPTYNAKSCFETFPFPAGLTPADTANQQTETLPGGAYIPAIFNASNPAVAQEKPSPAAIKTEVIALRQHAASIAQAAHRLNDLRENWLNPPEWTQRVPEVTPLGMDHSPYPDRILPKPGFEAQLAQRTLTKLYNQRPAWLDAAHKTLDFAVAAAYGWADYAPEMPDEEILQRLLALNLARSAG